MNSPLMNMLLPIVRQNLTQERTVEMFRAALSGFEVPEGARNMALLSEKDGGVVVTVVSVDRQNNIVRMHRQFPLVELISSFIESA